MAPGGRAPRPPPAQRTSNLVEYRPGAVGRGALAAAPGGCYHRVTGISRPPPSTTPCARARACTGGGKRGGGVPSRVVRTTAAARARSHSVHSHAAHPCARLREGRIHVLRQCSVRTLACSNNISVELGPAAACRAVTVRPLRASQPLQTWACVG